MYSQIPERGAWHSQRAHKVTQKPEVWSERAERKQGKDFWANAFIECVMGVVACDARESFLMDNCNVAGSTWKGRKSEIKKSS